MRFGFRFSGCPDPSRTCDRRDAHKDTCGGGGACTDADKNAHECEQECRGQRPNDLGNAPCVIDLSARRCAREDSLRSVWTGGGLQLNLVSVSPAASVCAPQLTDTDCLITVTDGECTVVIGGKRAHIVRGQAALVPAGTCCEIKNASLTLGLGLAIVCAPRAYPWGTDISLRE